jgi:hypothetical protein
LQFQALRHASPGKNILKKRENRKRNNNFHLVVRVHSLVHIVKGERADNRQEHDWQPKLSLRPFLLHGVAISSQQQQQREPPNRHNPKVDGKHMTNVVVMVMIRRTLSKEKERKTRKEKSSSPTSKS